ncbi:uncharacterized protein LTR77_009513 [Saxophila tyrrhenica]|uniref:Glutaredoxin-like protein n=1 Tax=Saxophila tyrrhenica TaxID=1690608 RepID=A0AAV9P1B3_9PEZI|nr:hypothetical protein LTR77_009513 [Saxophila tyrrhenica]
MRATSILYRQCVRLTFFTRPQCGLCDDAKEVLSKVWDRRPFEYDEINVMEKQYKKWRGLYALDTPVIHFDATEENNYSFETTTAARKLKHRITEEEVESAMDGALKTAK